MPFIAIGVGCHRPKEMEGSVEGYIATHMHRATVNVYCLWGIDAIEAASLMQHSPSLRTCGEGKLRIVFDSSLVRHVPNSTTRTDLMQLLLASIAEHPHHLDDLSAPVVLLESYRVPVEVDVFQWCDDGTTSATHFALIRVDWTIVRRCAPSLQHLLLLELHQSPLPLTSRSNHACAGDDVWS